MVVAILIAGVDAPARADQPAMTAMTALDEEAFIAALIDDEPRVARAEAGVAAARAEVVAAHARPEPTVAFDREEIFPDGGAATNYARVTLPLELSGRRRHRIAAGRAETDARIADRDLVRVTIVIEGLRAYAQASYARLYRDALAGDRAALVRAVEVVRKRAAAGAASGYDAQRLELELAGYDDLIASAELELVDTARALGALIGRPDAAIEPTTPLSLPAPPPPLEQMLVAHGDRPDYRAASLRGEAARAQSRAADRAWVPGLAVSAGVMSADVGTDTALGYTAGLAITIPIFDRGQADRARAAAGLRAARAETRWLERTLPTQVRRARDRLVGRRAQAEALASSRLARLDDLLRAAETAYREGDASVVELLDAYRTARDTHLRALELRRDARLAELELWLAIGQRPGGTP